MKKNLLLLVFVALLGVVSCEKTDDSKYADYLVARPLTISKAEFKNSVDIISPSTTTGSQAVLKLREMSISLLRMITCTRIVSWI